MNDVWSDIGAVPPAELVDPSLELHWAVQIVAAAGQNFAEKKEDDSHRAMKWDASQSAFVGAEFAGPYPFRVGVRPADLTLVILDRTDETLGALPLSGETIDGAHAWLATGLATYLGGAPPHLERPDWDMPSHPLGEGAPFTAGHSTERALLADLFGGAAAMLDELISTRNDASGVLCWPHHFDIATLLTVKRGSGDDPRQTVGVGLAPRGGGYDTWYWYVTPYPHPRELPDFEGPGGWHTEGWTGLVLTGEELVSREGAFRDAALRKFLDVAVDTATRALAS